MTTPTTPAARDWAAIGIGWHEEKVARRQASGTTAKAEITGTAQIPFVTNVDLALGHFGGERLCAALDAQGWRVPAQDVNRAQLPNKPSVEALREAVYNRLMGIRNAPRTTQVVVEKIVTVETKIYTLADGTTFKPDASKGGAENLISYQQAAMAALVDVGVPSAAAQNIVRTLTL